MEKKLQNPGVVFALALLCCALWGSAFPCVKIGYEWLAIEGAGSQILFAGYRFFLAGIFTFLIGSFLGNWHMTLALTLFSSKSRYGNLSIFRSFL